MDSVALAQDEQVFEQVTFERNAGFSYLTVKKTKATLTVTNRRFIQESQTYALGIIPLGPNNTSFPLDSISSVNSTSKTDWPNLILGIILVLAIFAGLWVLAIVGLLFVLTSFYATVTVTSHSGARIHVPISSRSDASEFVNKVNLILAQSR